MKKLRFGAVEVSINADLSVSYKLTLHIREAHIHLFNQDCIKSYTAKSGKNKYYYSFESSDRRLVLHHMQAAQLIVTETKIAELKNREEFLLASLSASVLS